ncbi:MAG: tRNA (adenosine(37)-N6)-threonylcarbamoyltransferase complex transferase subunit TsaD [Candidatus Wallbacteria bacterium]|nr:tRNA (adenosine(37)-N6)-threonylcarbamoyltransferase complex transferase subunit TsaD [Candidatus Wallbacteria bacterium]
MLALGIETSCDDTSLALVEDGVLLECLTKSQDQHSGFGGVVPEQASREHAKNLSPLFTGLLEKTGLKACDIGLVAASQGPGLVGALLAGVQFGRGLSLSLNCQYFPVNHLEGHIYSPFLHDAVLPDFPWLILLVSGGHTMLILAKAPFSYRILGGTTDDSVGECFDKVARYLDLGYPGGPAIERLSAGGNSIFRLPRSFLREESYRFSYSGLKTATLKLADDRKTGISDLCASFQEAAIEPLITKTVRACREFHPYSLLVAGGVSANESLRSECLRVSREEGCKLFLPAKKWAMDNAGMVAAAAYHRWKSGAVNPGYRLCVDPGMTLYQP